MLSRDERVEAYVESHLTPEEPYLNKVNRLTHLETTSPRMLSGHLQGQILKILTGMLNPSRVLEIGTFTGYSALCFAQGSGDHCRIDTIDIDDEMESRVLRTFNEAGYGDKIRLIIGDALKVIPSLNEMYDLVFIDGDKRQYLECYHLVFDKVRKGGVILADNVLWDGKVVDPVFPNDKQTQAILEFNDFVSKDNRVECAILPLRDGIFMIRKL